MECNCPRCLGIGDGLPIGYVEPPEEKEPTVYEKLVEIEEDMKQLKKKFPTLGDQLFNRVLQKVIDLAEEIDSIDSEVIKLQKKYDSVELGELSKKLY